MNERARHHVVVAETGTGRYVNAVTAGPHTWHADEPVPVGGQDAGPAPYDMLGAALGACTSITLRMYAERKGWPVTRIAVEVSHEQVRTQGATATERVDRFRRTIDIDGDLTDEQRAAMLSIANRCPVHRTLSRGSEIVTELA